MKSAIITADQIRAARALLDWPREVLAERSGVSLRTLASIESNEASPRVETLAAIRATLADAGITFIARGVRLFSP